MSVPQLLVAVTVTWVVPTGKNVVVIEDLISTGGSSLKAVDALRESDAIAAISAVAKDEEKEILEIDENIEQNNDNLAQDDENDVVEN
mgnify:CR=1 FL=1